MGNMSAIADQTKAIEPLANEIVMLDVPAARAEAGALSPLAA